MTAPSSAIQSTSTDDDDLNHVVCCDNDRALCGTDVSHAVWHSMEDPTTCVVCADLEELPCERCGE